MSIGLWLRAEQDPSAQTTCPEFISFSGLYFPCGGFLSRHMLPHVEKTKMAASLVNATGQRGPLSEKSQSCPSLAQLESRDHL